MIEQDCLNCEYYQLKENIEDYKYHLARIVIDNIQQNVRPMVIWQKAGQGSALIKNVTYQNVRILDGNNRCQASGIYTNGNAIEKLIFDRVTYNGTAINQSGKWTVDRPDNVDIIYQ